MNMITQDEFEQICKNHGLVRSNTMFNVCYTFPGLENLTWAEFFERDKAARCWNTDWKIHDVNKNNKRPSSCKNDIQQYTSKEFEKELSSMVMNFKRMNKQIRLNKIEEL